MDVAAQLFTKGILRFAAYLASVTELSPFAASSNMTETAMY
jgi:hypothetical protein